MSNPHRQIYPHNIAAPKHALPNTHGAAAKNRTVCFRRPLCAAQPISAARSAHRRAEPIAAGSAVLLIKKKPCYPGFLSCSFLFFSSFIMASSSLMKEEISVNWR